MLKCVLVVVKARSRSIVRGDEDCMKKVVKLHAKTLKRNLFKCPTKPQAIEIPRAIQYKGARKPG